MTLPEIRPGPQLANLIAACETCCVHDCCGIDAFHFSPLHVAAHLSRFGAIEPHSVREIVEQLQALLEEASLLAPDETGDVCSLARTNSHFSMAELREFAATITLAMHSAPAVLALSDKLEGQMNGNSTADGI
jgi:hypothetical protein